MIVCLEPVWLTQIRIRGDFYQLRDELLQHLWLEPDRPGFGIPRFLTKGDTVCLPRSFSISPSLQMEVVTINRDERNSPRSIEVASS